MDNKTLMKLKAIYDQVDYSSIRELMEKEFPELAKSEDEWLIEEILFIVRNYRESCIDEGHHKFDDCIAWLEKQGEQKPKQEWSVEDERMFNEIIGDIYYGEEPHYTNEEDKERFSKEKKMDWLRSLKRRMKGEHQ